MCSEKGKDIVFFGLRWKRLLRCRLVQCLLKLAASPAGVARLHMLFTQVPGNPVPVKEENGDDDAVAERRHQESEKNEYDEELAHDNHRTV